MRIEKGGSSIGPRPRLEKPDRLFVAMGAIIKSEEPPNPNARRYVVGRPVQEQAKGRFFVSADQTDEPLAHALFAIQGVEGVMFLPNSITVNKANEAAWEAVDPAAREAIENYFT
ncbi:MAG: NifU N-terminal domain-containing protein [Candidatus Methylomirabilales bacterium]